VGAINFFYPEPKTVDLRWVVVNFNPGDQIKIEGNNFKTNQVLNQYFKKAFNPSLVDINIVNDEAEILDLTKRVTDIAEINYVAKIKTHLQEGTTDQAKSSEEERKALMGQLDALHKMRNDGRAGLTEVTLLLTNLKCQIPVADSEDTGSNNGITIKNVSLMFFGNRDKFPEKEIPHEIMHGIGLQHTFKEKNDTPASKKHTYQKKGTPNVMDYEGDQNRTYYWQWQEIYNSNYSK
jgi:hypothetical protein